MAGGHGDAKDVDAEKAELFAGFRDTVQERAGTTYPVFEPVKYTQQVVAGMIFHIKYKVGDDAYVHVRVFKPLPHTGEPAQCQALAGGKTLADPIEVLEAA